MTITLDLPSDLESELSAEATRFGVPLAEYVLRVLVGRFSAGDLATGEELVSFWSREGLIGSRPDITDSQSHSRGLRSQAEQRGSRS